MHAQAECQEEVNTAVQQEGWHGRGHRDHALCALEEVDRVTVAEEMQWNAEHKTSGIFMLMSTSQGLVRARPLRRTCLPEAPTPSHLLLPSAPHNKPKYLANIHLAK